MLVFLFAFAFVLFVCVWSVFVDVLAFWRLGVLCILAFRGFMGVFICVCLWVYLYVFVCLSDIRETAA